MVRDPQQAEKTRKKIMESAIDEFANVGFHRARISDIVANAGYSPRTFYIYFENKEVLYKELLEDWKNRIIKKFTIEKGNENYSHTIRKRWKSILEIMMENPGYTKSVFYLNPFIEEIRSELLQALISVTQWEQENGFIRNEIRLDFLGHSILATIERVIFEYLLPQKENIDFLADEITDLYVNGVCTIGFQKINNSTRHTSD